MSLFLVVLSNIIPQPLQARSSLGEKNQWREPTLLLPLWKLIFSCSATGKQNSCLPHWQILEDCFLLISLFFLRLNKSHFFVFLFGANFHINFYSFNLFDLLGIPSKFFISVLRALN